MLFKRQGKPEEGELVICTVTNIQHNSIFARLDDYNITGMIHISEISPGRIRNIRDFVREGKVIICKVLKIHYATGHVDLSLRRVSESMRREKADEIKQEQKAEKIVEIASHQLKMDVNDIYEKLSKVVFERYMSMHECFNDISKGLINLEAIGVDKKIATALTELIMQRIKSPEVSIKGNLFMTSYDPKGIERIKTALKTIKDKSINVKYIRGGEFRVDIKGTEFKETEDRLMKSMNEVMAVMEKDKGIAKFVKEEGKKEKV